MSLEHHTLISSGIDDFVAQLPADADRLQLKRVYAGAGSKVIRISFVAGQVMREHSAATPILVQVLRGRITFLVEGRDIEMPAGALIHVDSGVPHSLTAHEESHVLLILMDEVRQVQ